MLIVAVAALLSFGVTETWRRRRFRHYMTLAATHAADEAFLNQQAKKWKAAAVVATWTATTGARVTQKATGLPVDPDEWIARLTTIQHFYELQAIYHAKEGRLCERTAKRPLEPAPSSPYFPDSNRLLQQAALRK